MSFSFQVLGLFIIYLLMCMYFGRKQELREKNRLFSKLMVFNFLNQLLYLLIFIVLNKESYLFIRVYIIKIFMASIVIEASLLFGYIYSKGLRYKYRLQDVIYDEKVRKVEWGLVIGDILFVLVSFILPIDSMNKLVVLGEVFPYTYLVSMLFIILSLIVLFIYMRKINNKDYLILNFMLLILMVIFIVQYSSSSLGIVVSGYSFVILFLYLTMESGDARVIRYLKVAKDSAERTVVSNNEFLEKLSREIRGPLNTIDGFSQVIIDEDNIENIKEDAKDIRLASNNLIDLINGLMDISLIESSKMEIVNRDYDTMEMLESVSMIGKTLIGKKKIDFKVDYSNNIPKVLCGDSEKIKRVLVNLFRNASQYTTNGEILFKVSCVNSDSVCRLIMSVSDTGCGIKKEELSTIFNKYEYNTNKSDTNGLGLAIVDNLIKLMNGKIDVNSEVGKGSVFTVVIDQKIVQAEGIKNIKTCEIVNTFDASGKRVLVVDDNKLNLKVATKLLEVYNVEVVQAGSGQEFLDIIDNDHNYDLILMDDMMPNMSGKETLDIYRKIERVDGIKIPVVALTANAISGMRDEYLKVGFDEYLAKPIDKYELNKILKKFLVKNDKMIKKNFQYYDSKKINRIKGKKIYNKKEL